MISTVLTIICSIYNDSSQEMAKNEWLIWWLFDFYKQTLMFDDCLHLTWITWVETVLQNDIYIW